MCSSERFRVMTSEELHKVLYQLEASRSSRKRAWKNLQELRWVLQDSAGLKALHLAGRTSEALESIKEAEALAERFELRWWSAELRRLHSMLFLFRLVILLLQHSNFLSEKGKFSIDHGEPRHRRCQPEV
jgi:hypothetical protein